MRFYYINPKGRDLIIYDPDEKQLVVLPSLKVTVIGEGAVQFGDFEGRGGTDIEGGNHRTARGGKKQRRAMHCKNCGEAGHRRDTCPQKT